MDRCESQYEINGARAQGKFVGKSGSVIENAKIGVQLWGPNKGTDAGGIIDCRNTIFRNNQIAVEFAPYDNWWPFDIPSGSYGQPRSYKASFWNCKFIANNDYPNQEYFSEPFKGFLKLVGVNGVKITAGRFFNSYTPENSNSAYDYGYGIQALDAGFSVRAIQKVPSYYKKTHFEGLGFGVYTANTLLNRPFRISHAEFSNCYFGVYNKGVQAGTLLFNKFNMGSVANMGAEGNYQVGVMFESGISGFEYQENEFILTSDDIYHTIGSISKNLGTFNNVIRKNQYDGIELANLSNGINGGWYEGRRGLKYLCNINTNINGFRPRNYVIQVIQGSEAMIHPIQGFKDEFESKTSAGNIFSYVPGTNESDIYVHNGLTNTVEYYFDPQGTNEEPIDISSGIKTEVADIAIDCGSDFCLPPCKVEQEIISLKGVYYDNKEKYNDNIVKYNEAMNNGNDSLANIYYSKLGHFLWEMDRSAYMVVVHALYDTIGYNRDTVRTWISNLNNYGADLWLAKDFLYTGDTAMAFGLLDQVPSEHNLTTNQLDDLEEIKELFSLIAHTSVYELDSNTIYSILQIANNQSGIHAPIIAQNILLYYGWEYSPIYYIDEGQSELTTSSDVVNAANNESQLSIIPNPARDFVNFMWKSNKESEPASINVFDYTGKKVWNKELKNSTEKVTWMINDAPAGVYLSQLVFIDGTTKVSSFVIIK